MVASQREAKTVILQSNRRLVQKRDLASDAQSLVRIGDHLWRQSRTPKKNGTPALLRRAIARRERPPPAIGIEARSCSEFRAEAVPLLIIDRPAGRNCPRMASTNKCLA